MNAAWLEEAMRLADEFALVGGKIASCMVMARLGQATAESVADLPRQEIEYDRLRAQLHHHLEAAVAGEAAKESIPPPPPPPPKRVINH